MSKETTLSREEVKNDLLSSMTRLNKKIENISETVTNEEILNIRKMFLNISLVLMRTTENRRLVGTRGGMNDEDSKTFHTNSRLINQDKLDAIKHLMEI